MWFFQYKQNVLKDKASTASADFLLTKISYIIQPSQLVKSVLCIYIEGFGTVVHTVTTRTVVMESVNV